MSGVDLTTPAFTKAELTRAQIKALIAAGDRQWTLRARA